MKLKNSNCDETQKLKLRWNLKTQIVMKLKLSWNSKTQIATISKTPIAMKLKKSNFDETKN